MCVSASVIRRNQELYELWIQRAGSVLEQLGLSLCLWSVLGNQEVGRSLHVVCAAHPGRAGRAEVSRFVGAAPRSPEELQGWRDACPTSYGRRGWGAPPGQAQGWDHTAGCFPSAGPGPPDAQPILPLPPLTIRH